MEHEQKTYTVPVICAWCEKKLGTKGGMVRDEPTHDCCPRCRRLLRGDPVSRRIRESLKRQDEEIQKFQDIVTEFKILNHQLLKLVEGIDKVCEDESPNA